MDNFNQEGFNQFVLNNNVIGFFEKPIKLKSGRMSNWYVNWRDLSNDVYLLNRLTNFIITFTNDLKLNPDCFYGVPEGATKLGIITQFKWAMNSYDISRKDYSLPMGRGKPKDHGDPKDKYFVGVPSGNTIILEDVTTTGGSLLTTIDNLIETDVNIIAAIGLTNRMELRDDRTSVKDAVEAKGVPYHHLSNGIELLQLAYRNLNPGETIKKGIEKEFEKYGVEKLKLKV